MHLEVLPHTATQLVFLANCDLTPKRDLGDLTSASASVSFAVGRFDQASPALVPVGAAAPSVSVNVDVPLCFPRSLPFGAAE